ncbi:MAG: hypothetical protein KC731_41520 [Myxococcales bacterium]|nr:hypothetical protein [Myxococcales bacterium]
MHRGVWGLSLALSAASLPAAASPQDVIGFGFRSTAMGRAGVASATGVDAVYLNPSLLSASRDLELQLGTTGASFALSAEGPGLARPLEGYSALRASTVGVVVPLPFTGLLEDRLALGLGLVTPYDVVVRGRILYPEKPQYLFADRVQSVAVIAGLGIDIGYGIRIGGGAMALAALEGAVQVSTDISGRLGTTVEDTLVASYAPTAGASLELADGKYRIGVTFRGELVGRFNVVITAENLGALTVPPLNISGVAQYDPWQIAAEVARVGGGPWALALGATYKHWPAYPGPVMATVRCEDAPAESVCDPLPVAVADYRPVVTPHVGAERAFEVPGRATLFARAGYAFEPSPAPPQTGRTSYFDNHRSVFGLGYGLRLDAALAPIAFDGFVQLQWLHARSHEKSAAEGAERDGVVDTHGIVLAGGTSASVRF